MAMPVILKGDTSARISFLLTDNFSYEGYSLRVDFHHVSYEIYDLKAGSTVSVQYTAEETSRFPLGTGLMTLTLENEEGVRRTLPVERVKVTDAPAEVYDGAIIIDPGMAKVEDLPERFTDNDVRSKINQILSFLRRCAAFCLLGIMSYGFVAASVLTAPKGEIYNDSPVVTNVNLEGLAKTDEVIPRKVEGYWETIVDGMGLHLLRTNSTDTASFTPEGVDVGGTGYQDGKIYYNGQYLSLPSVSKDETFAVKSDISATDPTFSNAVLAVGLNIDANSVAVLNEIASTFGGFPIEGTATTVGGLLAALAAAVAWLRKNKADKVANATSGNLAALDENGNLVDSGKAIGDFALAESLAPAFVPYNPYEVGDLCTSFDNEEYHRGTWLYKCILATDGSQLTMPEIDTTHWALATVEDVLSALRRTVEGKVDKEAGKGLSTNDYTNEDKAKLAGIEAGAQKNPDLSGYATKDAALPRYYFTILEVVNGVVTVPPYTSATMPGDGTAFTVAVGEGNGYMRDCILIVECGDVAPTITWPANFHPRTDAETDFACVAGATNVYWISEYAQGEFVVAGWQQTAGGSAV